MKMIKSKNGKEINCCSFTSTSLFFFFKIIGLCWWPGLCSGKHPLSFHRWLRSIHYVLCLTWSLLNAHLTKFYMTELSQWVREQMASWLESTPALFYAFSSLPQRCHMRDLGGLSKQWLGCPAVLPCSQLWSLGRHSYHLSTAGTF